MEFFFDAHPWQRVIRRAADIFALVERDEVEWPEHVEFITRATFQVRLRDAKRSRLLTIVPCNRALYRRDGDSARVEAWLAEYPCAR